MAALAGTPLLYPTYNSHSLGSLDWLPSFALENARVHPIPASKPPEDSFWDESDPSYAEDLDDEENMMVRMRARMQDQFNMMLQDTAQQYREDVNQHVLKFFKSVRTRENCNRSYDLEIAVVCMRPRIWRLVRVPGGLPLHALVDRVLIPAMGYIRGYHSYRLLLPSSAYKGRKRPPLTRDVSFIPVQADTVDMMHRTLLRGGKAAIDSEQVLLADVLRAEGDSLLWDYDLGDHLRHLITLKAIHPGPVPEGDC